MDLPTAWANYVSIVGFLFVALVVWAIPRRLIYQDAPDHAAWRDIRIWASVLVSIQLVLYLVFT